MGKPFNLAALPLGICYKEILRDVYKSIKPKDVHCSILYDSEKMEATLIPSSRRLIT